MFASDLQVYFYETFNFVKILSFSDDTYFKLIVVFSFYDFSKDWWKRTFKSEYLPPVTLSSEILRNAVEENGLVGKRVRFKFYN